MVVDLDVGTMVTLLAMVVGAWWGLAKMLFAQMEKRQNERFDELSEAITGQEAKLDGHLTRQDDREKSIYIEIRRVESQLAQCQVDAATRYQTKDDAGKQFGQLIQEIRNLGTRIDALHGKVPGGQ